MELMSLCTWWQTYDGLLDSTKPDWLQWDFGVLIGLFEWVWIITNMENTVEMVCHPETISGQQSSAAYGRWIDDEGYPNNLRQIRRVVCGGCGS